MRLKHTILFASALTLSACSHTSQFSSGKDYLTRYDATSTTVQSSTDLDVRRIAAIEPDIAFPARIGLARIESGRLISVPSDEAESWQILTDRLGADFGEFVPVSPLVAAMVNPHNPVHGSTKEVVDNIRRGSARQHLDYVLIYEVSELADNKSNALRVADLSILGLFVLPSRSVKVDTTATAMLIDVRNGYPYGSASAFSEKSAVSTAIGSRGNKERLKDKSRIVAVDNLTDEVEAFMFELREEATSRTASR